MTDLKQIQESFQRYLRQADVDAIISEVVSTEKLSASTRLSIYGDAYEARLVDALASNFPYLQTYLGEDEFYRLASAYVAEYPSTYRSVRWYGDQFHMFLQQTVDYHAEHHVHEMAQLDWVMTLVFDAEDAEVMTLDQMASIPPESWPELRFQFHPSVHRLQFSWNVIEFWQSEMSEDKSVSLQQYSIPVEWLFWRKELENHFQSLSLEEAMALDAVKAGANFTEVCEKLSEFMDEDKVAVAAASMLKTWIVSGLIVVPRDNESY